MTYFWIDGHDMRVIEVDGVSLPLFVALRNLASYVTRGSPILSAGRH